MLRDLAVLMPHSLLVNYNLVEQLLRTNRPRDAVEAYDRLSVDVHTLRHSIGAWRVRLVTRALHQLGEHERELAESRDGQRQTPGKLFFVQAEVRALAALGRLDELERVADRSLTIRAATGSGTSGDVLREAALELRAHGHPRASLVYAQRSVDWWRGHERGGHAERASLGRALYAAEHWSEAEREFAALSAQAPENPEYTFYRGLSAAGHGDMARARDAARILRQQAPDPDQPGYVTYLRAELAAALGERALAVDLLREALANGVPYGMHIHQSRAFNSLRSDAAFRQLVRLQE
jgi:predicted Zn-dependent protease